MRSARTLGRLAVAAPASVPALYAWGVTVAPVVWGRAHVPSVALAAAVAGPVLLAGGMLLERIRGYPIRSQYLLGFTLACGVCWVSAATPGQPFLDAPYAVAGILAWGALALSWAAPPVRPPSDAPIVLRVITKVQDPFPRGASVNIALGFSVAVGLQLVSFEAKSPERALLFRLVAVACSLCAIGVSAAAALTRLRRKPP